MNRTTRLKKPQIPELDTLYQFDDLGGRPKYGGVEMTSETDIPSFQEIMDETHSAVVAEATARDDADDALQAQIDSLDSDLTAETTAREAADQAEATAREAADAAEAAARAQAISDEASARATADATLQSNIDTVASNLATEATTRADADTALGTRIDGVVGDLATEASTRADADTALGTRIDGVASDLETETSNRQSADATLQSNITAEETARANADTTLQTNIDNLSAALTTETTNRTNADTALGTRIDGVAGDLATETTNRQTADTNLQTAISDEASARANADTSLQTALSTETTARQTADTGLQSQIDAIVASSDVKDIVGTKAELNNYDTSTLGDNDIIKVLQDESENNATTYYRWNATTQQFSLIGEEGPYYTKSQADTLLNAKQNTLTAGSNVQIVNDTISATDTTYTAGSGLALNGTQFSVDTTAIATQSDLTAGLATKQDTLTAGANIQINNNTISATDTTYSDFTGTDGTTAGTAGLVPAPATTDAGKFLKADGTWDTAGSAINVVQTTGTSTTDVMSQNAVTSMVFADPSTRYKVQIGNNAVTSGAGATSIGGATRGTGNYSVAIGNSTRTTGANSVALGSGADASQKGQFDISTSFSGSTLGYNDTQYRLLTGLYDPQSAHDAATKGYVDTQLDGKQDELTPGTGISITEESGALVISATGAQIATINAQDWSALWQ